MNLREIAADTVRLVDERAYPGIDAAIAGTVLHTASVPPTGPANPRPVIEVTRESSLEAARRLGSPAVLVFASARRPGGGFLRGAQAQEESIARSSALYACQLTQPGFYRRGATGLYTDDVIYSPGVPVFRDDDGTLLERAHTASMLTCAAPNVPELPIAQLERVPPVLSRRAVRVLEVAAYHGERVLVLGAWGCGVFGNDPAVVAPVWASALREVPYFDHVTFAILGGGPAFETFAKVLSPVA